MAKITRKNQKIFAGSASNNGQFGSALAGTKVLTNDLDTIQALAAFNTGWNNAVAAGRLPTLEEIQALEYMNTTQLAYIFQEGIAEWNTSTEYHIGSIVKKTGTFEIYGSLINTNTGNALPAAVSNANWRYLGLWGDQVTGTASSTNNAIPKYNGTTGKLIQNSGVTIDGSNNIAGVNNLNVVGIANISSTAPLIQLNDTDAAVDAKLVEMLTGEGGFKLRFMNEAYNAPKVAYSITRSGNNITSQIQYVDSGVFNYNAPYDQTTTTVGVIGIRRTSATPSSTQIARNDYTAKDSANNDHYYAATDVFVTDNTNGSEDARYGIFASKGGVLTSVADFGYTSAGVGAINAGEQINAAKGVVGLTTADQTYTNGTAGAIAHGLGREPFSTECVAVCQTAEGGYAIGDRIVIASAASNSSSAAFNSGLAIQYTDTTNIRWRASDDGILATNKTTGETFSLTAANWKLRFKYL